MMANFEINDEVLGDAVIIAAVYDNEGYDGTAMVVLRKEGKLYEVHGSHCSCNGLEGQWDLEETSYEALMDRLEKTKDYQIERFGEAFEQGLRRGLLDELFEREVLLK